VRSGWPTLAWLQRPARLSSCRGTIREAPPALVLYVPLTSQNRASRYEVELRQLHFLKSESVANVQGLGSLPVTRLERKLGQLPDDVLRKIHQALKFAFDLE